MNPIYNAAIFSYSGAVKLAALKNKKARKMVSGHMSTFKIIRDKFAPDDRPIWIHASSLGEFEQGRPMIEMIKREYPNQKILLSFFSPSGYEVRKNYPEVDAVCYLPFDTPRNARRFVKLLNPKMAVFIKYEFWSNYLHALKKHDIPTFIISSIFRETQSFFKWYGGTFRAMLSCYTEIFVQDEHSKKLLESIGTHSVEVAGDTRFDRVTDILASAKSFPNVEAFGAAKPTLIMGSSWTPDEDVVLDYINTHKDWNLIIAPHVINQVRLEEIKSRLKRPVQCYTEIGKQEPITADCLIIDCFGILSSCYRYGTVAYIGGGHGAGIHNINEAAVYGMPVVFGPNHKKFKEAHDLLQLGGAFEVTTPEQFAAVMDTFSHDAASLHKAGKVCHDYIQQNLGATKKIFERIRHCIEE